MNLSGVFVFSAPSAISAVYLAKRLKEKKEGKRESRKILYYSAPYAISSIYLA